jgi:hypothetical protein
MQMPPYLHIQQPQAPQVLPLSAFHLNPPKLLPQQVSHMPALHINAPTGLFSPVGMAPPVHEASAILPNNYQQSMPATTSTYQV